MSELVDPMVWEIWRGFAVGVADGRYWESGRDERGWERWEEAVERMRGKRGWVWDVGRIWR